MVEKKFIVQADVNVVWEKEWKGGRPGKKALRQRLFVEGYPIFRKYFPTSPQKILDVGGGTGRYGIRLGQDFPGVTVYITDILPESLDVARSIAEEVGVTNVEMRQEDVNALGFPDDHFDVVFCDVVIQHLPNVTRAMKEMRRVLKRGGLLIVSVNNFWNPHTLYKLFKGKSYYYGYEKSYTRRELRNLFRAHSLLV